MGPLHLLIQQLKRSRTFAFLLLLTIALGILGIRIYLPAYLILIYLMLAATTAIHESLHIKRAEELGHPVRDVEVVRVGSVIYRLEAPAKVMSEVARAPYLRPHQYLLEAAFLAALISFSLMAPVPERYLLLFLNAFPLLHLLSTVCVLIVFRTGQDRGPCGRLARFASPDDLEEGLGSP